MYGVEALDLARVFEAYRSISFKKKTKKNHQACLMSHVSTKMEFSSNSVKLPSAQSLDIPGQQKVKKNIQQRGFASGHPPNY
jgi:hypothetical protein